jgi:glycine betaine/proline transport system ATP-binding protein
VVMGLSGSGKSTLLRMLNGLIQPSAGEILVSGRRLGDLSGSELRMLRRRSMAMVFQSFALFPHRSALENAAFGLEVAGMPKRQRQERAQQALERVGLGNDLHRRPDQLSGGMRQRVGLARALALDPPILLMDEAFSALDPLIRRDMQDLLLDLQREHRRTVVFISHDLDEAVRIGDRIALMQEGRLLQCGTAEELLRHPAEEAVNRFFKAVDASAVLRVGALAEPAPDGMVLDLGNRSLPLLNAATLVRDAIPTVARANRPVPVVGDDHHLIGVVTPQTLLRAIATP